MLHRDLSIRSVPERVTVDVILDRMESRHLMIREDETKPPRRIPRYGVKMKVIKGSYVSLSMSERQAVNLNLI